MSTLTTTEPQRIHPHRFIMWVAIGSIVMMFAGMTSAYIVKKNQGNWLAFELPVVFWYSTAVILASSLTIYLANVALKAGKLVPYKLLITITSILGILFVKMQWTGFQDLEMRGIALIGTQSNSSSSFLFIITGMHMLHVLGGVVALVVLFFRSFWLKKDQLSLVPVQIVATYWHFVDILWIYLFIFFHLIA
ncbi:MAG: heme-copper oxidase subunit III [Bacteroidota bacterium]|jgi:cytochrome c oxidase subunit III